MQRKMQSIGRTDLSQVSEDSVLLIAARLGGIV
jgi:hypothetical protein